jgi:hypothetical protein
MQFPASAFDADTFVATLNTSVLLAHLLPHKLLRVGAIYAYYQYAFLAVG